MEQLVCSGGIPAVPQNRKLSEFHSEPFCREEKCSEFCAMEQKYKQTLIILFWTIPRERKLLGIPFRRTKIEINSRNLVPKLSLTKTLCLLEQVFLQIYFFHPISFRSEPRNWLGMPRNEHFFRGIKETHSESIPWNFYETKFRCQPYTWTHSLFIQKFGKSLHLTGRGGAALSVAASGTFLWPIMWVVGGRGGGDKRLSRLSPLQLRGSLKETG
jgi:hypothetical protein